MRHAALCAVSLFVIVGHADAQRLSRPTIDTLDHHIVRVTNAGPSAWNDTNGWKLVYERTVQPAEDDPQAFGDIGNVTLLSDGRVVEAETAHPVVRLFAADGRFRRVIGRDGEGPGEYRNPFVMNYHDSIVIQDQRLHRATVYTPDGVLVRSFASTCCAFGLAHWIDDRGRLIANALGKPDHGKWVIFDLRGKRLDSLATPQAAPPHVWFALNANGMPSVSVAIPYAGRNIAFPLHDGSILAGASDHYQFVISGNGRDTVRIFGRSGITGTPIDAALRDSAYQMITERIPEIRSVAHVGDIPAHGTLWDDVTQDASGNIWVFRAMQHNGTVADVFTVDGRYLGMVAVPFGARAMTAWAGNRVAVVDTDANDLPRIRIFRIEQRGLSANARH